MSYANDITGLCEDAAQAYLQSVKPTRIPVKSIFTGLDDETLVLPRIVCTCKDANRILEGAASVDGKWDAMLKITVRTNSDDTPRKAHRVIAGEVFAAFAGERFQVADALSSFGGFTADDILMKDQGWDQIKGDNNRSWLSWVTYSVKCRGSNSQ